MGLDRQLAVRLIDSYVPATGTLNQGTVGFDHICKDYGNSGTTCGFPTHWLLWRLGASPGVINRNEPDYGCTYESGKNIARIGSNNAFVKLNTEDFKAGHRLPRPGDTIFISGGIKKAKDGKSDQYDEHVYVVLSEPMGSPAGNRITWRVSNFGQGDPGTQSGQILTRGVQLGSGTGPDSQTGRATAKNNVWADTKDSRQFMGWLDIGSIDFSGKLPQATAWDPLAGHSKDQNSPPLPSTIIGVWRVTKPYKVCYYMFQKGHRVFRINEPTSSLIEDAGFWFPVGVNIRILWESYLQDDLEIKGEKGSGKDDFSAYEMAKTLTTPETVNQYDKTKHKINPALRKQHVAGAR